MSKNLKETFSGKKVFITGHTGFKGSWLTLWLLELGAEVIGYSLKAPTTPNLFSLAKLQNDITHYHGDVRDAQHLKETMQSCGPDIVFHLAAQPLVLPSFEDPLETFGTNAIGTANVLEACRWKKSIKAVVVITTDKCYENNEWVWGYRENDPLGGQDPYSASKAMAEIAAASFRHSFFSNSIPIATARAGNVIGGGDFSEYRLVPDSMKALLNRKPIAVRNPRSTRPWMHVLDPLHGYLILAQKLLEGGQEYAEAWNFGPQEHASVPAAAMVEKVIELWGNGDWIDASDPKAKPEMNTLKLNWDKAANRLGWFPTYNWKESLAQTVHWFKSFEKHLQDADAVDMKNVCIEQIHAFMNCYRTPLTSTQEKRNEIYSHTP